MSTTIVDEPTTAYPSYEPLAALNRDLRKAARTMRPNEMRYLVDQFYQMQEQRKRTANQLRVVVEAGEPNEVLQWLGQNTDRLELSIKSALQSWAESDPVAQWALSITGLGPIISAALSAYIPIERTPSVSALWSFAGQNPTAKWNKGEKRPWNARLKVLCWKLGESFVKVSNKPEDVYGKLYRQRRDYEVRRNLAGEYSDIARTKLTNFNIGSDTEARPFYEGRYDVPVITDGVHLGYEDLVDLAIQTGAEPLGRYKAAMKLNEVSPGEGIPMLPPGHIHARAKRFAVKIFLSHWWNVAYVHHYRRPAPRPWIIEHGGHVDLVPVPNVPEWMHPFVGR